MDSKKVYVPTEDEIYAASLFQEFSNNEALCVWGHLNPTMGHYINENDRDLRCLEPNIEIMDKIIDAPLTSNFVTAAKHTTCGRSSMYEKFFTDIKDKDMWDTKVAQFHAKRAAAFDQFGDEWGGILIDINTDLSSTASEKSRAINCGDHISLIVNWDKAIGKGRYCCTPNNRWVLRHLSVSNLDDHIMVYISDATIHTGGTTIIRPRYAINKKPTVFLLGDKEYWTLPQNYSHYSDRDDDCERCKTFQENSPLGIDGEIELGEQS